MKWSNSQLDKLKSPTKNGADVTLKLTTNMIGIHKTIFLHNILLTDMQVLSLFKALAKFLQIIHQ